jgi:hypothetical protein
LEDLAIPKQKSSTIASKRGTALAVRQQAIVNRKHRMFCISSDGLEIFSHLFGHFPEQSTAVAKQLLDPGNHFGDSSTVDLPNMVAAMLNESILPDYNHTLLKWRGVLKDDAERQSHFRSILRQAIREISPFELRTAFERRQ